MRSPIYSARLRLERRRPKCDLMDAGRKYMKHLLASLAMLFALSLPPIARAQDVTLDFPSWQAEEPGFAEWWKGLVKEYEAKHPGVKVKLYSIPFANYVNQMTVRFAGQNPPD
ncbi:MAG: extracellular solute-binding protein, partial [Betaproteobacteria bacterium]